MTKKELKENASSHTYTGWNGHRIKINAFFFDWKQGVTENNKHFVGFKYMVNSNVLNLSKAELFDYFYRWVNGIINQLPWYINYKYAETDEQRFKIPISL